MKGLSLARMGAFVGSILFLLPLAGCTDTNPPTAPVSGTVTYQGQPLPTGTVMFVPTGGGATATGEIQSDGTYTLSTFGDGDGALIGSHKVAVSAVEVPDSELPEAKTLLPFKYSSDQTSGLTAEVTDQEMNVINFDLQ